MGQSRQQEPCPKCGASEPEESLSELQTLRCANCGFIYFPKELRQQDPQSTESGSVIEGTTLSPGNVRGSVVVHPYDESLEEAPRFNGAEIVVTDRLSPELSWANSMRGLVTETGDMTSPGATFARELEIPAVGGCPGVVDYLFKGERIELIDDNGGIRLLDRNAAGI